MLQVSRLLGRMRVAGVDPPPFVLGVLRIDSLETKSSLDVEAEQRAARAEVPAHDIYDVLPLEPEKNAKLRDLHRDGEFDLVIGNPPYVGEANNRPLFQHFRSLVQWKGTYKGKTDYLYYFLLLAIEKLRPGGKLCVITPAGWMNAGNADFLRERLASELTLEELYLFGSYKLFAADQGPAPTPTVESAILVATKAPAPKRHKLRVVALEDETAIAGMTRAELLAEMTHRALARSGRRGGIHVHSVRQADLRSTYPWPVKHREEDLATRVVKALEAALDDAVTPVERLDKQWKPFMGVQTCADAYSAKIQRRLSADVRRQLDRAGAALGEPIYALPPLASSAEPWASHPDALVQSPEPEGVLYGAVDPDAYVNLIYLTASSSPPRVVVNAVERWRPLLAAR
ncbi:MAG: Eco57I restriction-modification methylase domain-containing protein, partial [Vicinamibacteria bacterium]